MDYDKTLYRVALQLYIDREEARRDDDDETPTIEEAKAKVNHFIELAKAGEAMQGKVFEISKDDSRTTKVVVNERQNHIELAYELEDTDSGLLYDKTSINLPKDVFKQVAEYIISNASE